jgi:hypothetical protein
MIIFFQPSYAFLTLKKIFANEKMYQTEEKYFEIFVLVNVVFLQP